MARSIDSVQSGSDSNWPTTRNLARIAVSSTEGLPILGTVVFTEIEGAVYGSETASVDVTDSKK